MPPTSAEDANDALRMRLAELGVPLFEPTPGLAVACDADEFARLVVALLRSGDPRLVASIPCVLAAQPRANDASACVAQSLTPPERGRLGLLHYVARCLVQSRAPDLARTLVRAPSLFATEDEPRGVPEPDDEFGETGLVAVGDLDRGLVGDAVDLFDTWLTQLRLEQRSREPSRNR